MSGRKITKVCEWCKCEFVTEHHETRFCSVPCRRDAKRKESFLLKQAKAKELGVSMEELGKLIKAGKVNLTGRRYLRRQVGPKTYREIQAANRQRGAVAGWRGAPVMGGGTVRHNDAWLLPSEYVR